LGESQKETIKYAHEFRKTQISERLCWRCPVKTEKYTSDFSAERAPHINIHCLKIKKEGEKLVAVPKWVPDTRLTVYNCDFGFDVGCPVIEDHSLKDPTE
jgi:hypothetical protein